MLLAQIIMGFYDEIYFEIDGGCRIKTTIAYHSIDSGSLQYCKLIFIIKNGLCNKEIQIYEH